MDYPKKYGMPRGAYWKHIFANISGLGEYFSPLKPGWRWVENTLKFSLRWEKEEQM